tara:strand:+ start:1766 stop:2134 length:369 start_codon:yes stop_codon:yes gene_type:complete
MSVAKSKSFRGLIHPEKKTLKIINRERMNNFLETLTGEVDITISEISSRTHYQNNYYWKIACKFFGEELGYTKEEMHEVLKDKFNIESTSKLDMDEFRDYLDRIIRWAAINFQITLPDPDEE